MANETILVVDDSKEIIRFVTQYALIPLGYKVITASDGQMGLDMAIAQLPDLILLDMSMPRLTGLQVLAALRKNQINAPVIFMTMHGSEHIVAEVFRLGVRDYITKPFTIDEIKNSVDKALREERLSREKDLLSKQLVAADSVRQTVITLSHYINNGLAVVQGGLEEIQEDVSHNHINPEQWAQILGDSQGSVKKIKAVLKVLQQVTNVIGTNYLGNITMVDIEAALKAEIEKPSKTS